MRSYEFLVENDEAKIKQRVIRSLEKKKAEDPIFDKTYKMLVGPAIESRIENYISAHNDPDIGTEEMAFLIKTIPDLGNTEEIKQFVNEWNKGHSLIKTDELIPDSGMTSASPLISVVDEGIAKELFLKLSRQNFSKSDAGPAEAALAIMSNDITYAKEGGDLVINGKKIEVKGGGKSTQSGGGRVYNDRAKIDQSIIADVLEGTPYEGKNISVVNASGAPLADDFPKEEFIKAVSQAWFGEVRPNLVKTFGTPEFRVEWNKALFDDYAQAAGHVGILIIGASNYQYIVNGEQLVEVPQTSKGQLFYPKSRQTRDLGIQVSIG